MSGFLDRAVARSLGVAPVVHRRRDSMYVVSHDAHRNVVEAPVDVRADDTSTGRAPQAFAESFDAEAFDEESRDERAREQQIDGQGALTQPVSRFAPDAAPAETARVPSRIENRDDARSASRHASPRKPLGGDELFRAGFEFDEAVREREAAVDDTTGFKPREDRTLNAPGVGNSSGSYSVTEAPARSTSDDRNVLPGGRRAGGYNRADAARAPRYGEGGDGSANEVPFTVAAPTLRSVASWLTRESGAPASDAHAAQRRTESASGHAGLVVGDDAGEDRNERTRAGAYDTLDGYDAFAPRETAARAVIPARAQRVDEGNADDNLTINVSIGSIEIARPATAAMPSQPVRPSAPRPSLDDYLRLRQKVRGR